MTWGSIRDFACLRCGAEPGHGCVGLVGSYKGRDLPGYHQQRIDLAYVENERRKTIAPPVSEELVVEIERLTAERDEAVRLRDGHKAIAEAGQEMISTTLAALKQVTAERDQARSAIDRLRGLLAESERMRRDAAQALHQREARP